jgi:hypothetical protein
MASSLLLTAKTEWAAFQSNYCLMNKQTTKTIYARPHILFSQMPLIIHDLLIIVAINVWVILGIFIMSYPVLGNILRAKYI